MLGGAKISTKLKIIDFTLRTTHKLSLVELWKILLLALGNEIGESLHEKKMIKTARDLISIYGDKLLLPKDVVVTSKRSEYCSYKNSK